MREEVENPMIKESSEPLSIPYRDIVSEYHKIPGMDKYILIWKETEKREQARRTGPVS